MRPGKWLVLAAVPVLACAVTACQDTPSPRAEAALWLAAHPVPPAPGQVAALILPGSTVVGFAGTAARQACPDMRMPAAGPQLTAYHARAAGGLPGCGAWTATALTATGHMITLACGSIPARVECPLFRIKDGYIPDAGDFVLVRPGGGQVTEWDDIQVIEEFADSTLMSEEPDPGGPVFITNPAGGSH